MTPDPVRLTPGPVMWARPMPSRDGAKIFVMGFQNQAELIYFDKQSGQFMPFLDGLSADAVDVSRDGKWVSYVTYPEAELWRSKVDGTQKVQLSGSLNVAVGKWSPDGRRISSCRIESSTSCPRTVALQRLCLLAICRSRATTGRRTGRRWC